MVNKAIIEKYGRRMLPNNNPNWKPNGDGADKKMDEDLVSSCCGAGVEYAKEYDDCYPDRGRWVKVVRCAVCGSVCEAVETEDVEEEEE